MTQLNLWLERYSLRRAQIIENWSSLARGVEGLKGMLPYEELFEVIGPDAQATGKMAFIDGGQGIRELVGLAVYFIRASAFVMARDGGGDMGEVFMRDLDMNVIPHDQKTKERVEFLRDAMEFEIARRCGLKERPDTIFLDGSLFVKAFKKPIDCDEYNIYRTSFRDLVSMCKSEGIGLVGVSEDSKSRLFLKYLTCRFGVRFPPFMTDSTVLRILAPYRSFRSRAFIPDGKLYRGGSKPTLTEEFATAYLQPNASSNPLRVDVLGGKKAISPHLETLASLCRGSGSYGYPLPLYYAHMDSHIPLSQMDWTVRQIVNYVSKNDDILANAVMKSTRRMARPA